MSKHKSRESSPSQALRDELHPAKNGLWRTLSDACGRFEEEHTASSTVEIPRQGYPSVDAMAFVFGDNASIVWASAAWYLCIANQLRWSYLRLLILSGLRQSCLQREGTSKYGCEHDFVSSENAVG